MAYNTIQSRKVKRQNSGGDAKLAIAPWAVGLAIGILLPFLTDMVLFGTPFPCQTVTLYEDGSSIQKCEVRR